MNNKFKNLNKTIIKCQKCKRLTNFVKKISTEKRKQNINENYWGKPVTGFGDIDAKLLKNIVLQTFLLKKKIR